MPLNVASRDKRPYFLFHLLGWLAFIGFQIALLPNPKSIFYNKESYPFILDQLLINLIAIVFFYLNHYIFIPKFYFKKKLATFILLIMLSVGVSVFAVILMERDKTNTTIPTNVKGIPEFSENPLAPPKPVQKTPRIEMLSDRVILLGSLLLKFILVFLLSVGIRVYDKWQTAEEEKYKAELSFLKAQINPHFLFNTLNGIYTLAVKKSENTAPAIMRLSSIMRYVINEAHFNYVDIEKELKYITDYIDLQKMRLSNSIQVDFLIDAEHKNYKIAPLILIPFIENAFKHGISTEDNCTIKIHITIKDAHLDLFVENKKYNTILRDEEKSGIGMDNTKKRLMLLYADKHTLHTDDTKENYTVHLNIQLT
ncbi:MAG TPA: histidine kinase [Chitinophagales bacterium]|nr:histidine kinase [Chitinophagales bacterium]